MINQSNDKANPFLEADFNKILKIEIESINCSLSLQKCIQNTFITITDNLWSQINSLSDVDLIHKISKDLYDISNFCFQLQSNINCLEKLVAKLETLNLATNIDDIKNKFNEYHEESLKLLEESSNFNSSLNNFIANFSKNNSIFINANANIEINSDKNCVKEEIEVKEVLHIPDDLKENTLIISNTEIILPFTKNDLEDKFKTYNLTSCEEIIDTFYRKSAKSFEHSAISRFKEAYSLIINKEHGSKFQAISLGLELSTNYNLHPAIIAACKNLTQLDVYLSCLEYKELNDFHFFDIVYNIPPVPKKHIFKKFIENVQTQNDKISL